MAMIPIALITICYLYSGGDTSEAGKGAVFWLVIIYFWTVGIPISIASVVCGIKSFKCKKGILGILGLIIGALPLLVIVLVFASTFISIANS